MTDVGDPKQVKKRKTKQQLRREREVEYTKRVLATIEGRDVMWRLLEVAGLYHTSFNEASPHTTSFREGKRQIGLWTLAEMNEADPLAFQRMQQEHIDE